jgi:hypothetical protein
MTIFLARSISTAKWRSRTSIADNEIPADAVTCDMRTSDNRLSFWLYDPGKEGSLDEVALALASARDNIQRLDLVWLDHNQIQQMNLKIDSTPGQTPAMHLQHNHRDVAGLDVVRLVHLARGVADAVACNQTKRFSEKQVHDLLCKATMEKLIAPHDLKASVREKVQQKSTP